MCKIDHTLKNRYELNERIRENDQRFHENHPMDAMRLDYAFRHQHDRPEILETIIQNAVNDVNSMLDT